MAGYFDAQADLLHDISRFAQGRESLFWVAPLPDQGLLAAVYVWTDVSGKFGRFVAVAADDPFKPLFVDFAENLSLEGNNLDDCTVGSVRVRQPEPLRVAEISFDDKGLSLSARFTGIHEPFSWHQNAGGCPSWAADDRYEQSCLTEGHLRLGERDFEFTSAGHRDHSWGTRDWRVLQHWKWINASAGDDTSIHCFISFAFGDRLVHGYLNRDGVVSPIVEAEASADLDEHMVHRALSARVIDAEGRAATLEATRAAAWQMPIRHLYLNEVACSATIDDRPAVAHVELGWPAAYVDALVDRPG